jgi:hypothetical protein
MGNYLQATSQSVVDYNHQILRAADAVHDRGKLLGVDYSLF